MKELGNWGRAAALTLALMLFPSLFYHVTHAHSQGSTGPYRYQNLSYCQMTSVATAKALVTANCSTGSVPTQSAQVIAQICTNQAIRYRSDGTAPTAALGIPVQAGSCFQWSGDIRAIQIIQVSATATVDIEFYF